LWGTMQDQFASRIKSVDTSHGRCILTKGLGYASVRANRYSLFTCARGSSMKAYRLQGPSIHRVNQVWAAAISTMGGRRAGSNPRAFCMMGATFRGCCNPWLNGITSWEEERSDMNPTQRREQFRAILAGDRCVHPASVFDPISARI